VTRFGRRIAVALACLSAGGLAQIVAAVYVAQNRGFGSGDLGAFAYWNLLFALYVYATATVLRPRLRVTRVGPRIVTWTLIGGGAGFLWTWIVAAALGPWILTFSFPVLYIWTAAGALGGSALGWPDVTPGRGRPWLVLLVPPTALLAVVLLNWILLFGSRYVWARPEPEVFTFPDGFVGDVYVIHDSVWGRPIPTPGGTRRYDFAPSGILVTSSPGVRGWLDQRYYYRGADSTESQIRTTWDATIEDTEENRRDTTVGVYFLHWGTRQEADCTVAYMSFFVGRKADVLEDRGVDGLERYVTTACGAAASTRTKRSPKKTEAPGRHSRPPGGSDTSATRSRGLSPSVLLPAAAG
jgi:hypothetical protein